MAVPSSWESQGLLTREERSSCCRRRGRRRAPSSRGFFWFGGDDDEIATKTSCDEERLTMPSLRRLRSAGWSRPSRSTAERRAASEFGRIRERRERKGEGSSTRESLRSVCFRREKKHTKKKTKKTRFFLSRASCSSPPPPNDNQLSPVVSVTS